MNLSRVWIEELPLVAPRKSLFYWLSPGIQFYEVAHEELVSHAISHWFVPKLDPDFEHCYLPYSECKGNFIKCDTCNVPLRNRLSNCVVDRLSTEPLEVMEADARPMVSPAVHSWIVAAGFSGCEFCPVTDIGGDEPRADSAYTWTSSMLLRDASQFRCIEGCSVCGNCVVQCKTCNGLLSSCPGCGSHRAYEPSDRQPVGAAILSDWAMTDCAWWHYGLIVTGSFMKAILQKGIFGFMFGEVIVEELGASDDQVDTASSKSVSTEELLALVPGGAEHNHEIMESVI